MSETGGHARAGYRKCKYPTLSALTYVPAASLRMKLIIHRNRFSCSTEARNSEAHGRRKNFDGSLFLFIPISRFLDIIGNMINNYIYMYITFDSIDLGELSCPVETWPWTLSTKQFFQRFAIRGVTVSRRDKKRERESILSSISCGCYLT